MERVQTDQQIPIFKQRAIAVGKGTCVVALTALAFLASALVIHRGLHIIANHHHFWGIETVLAGSGMALGTVGLMYCAARCGAKRLFTYTGQDKDDFKSYVKGVVNMLGLGAFLGFVSPLAIVSAVNAAFRHREPNPRPVIL